jgi:hypothetical protein
MIRDMRDLGFAQVESELLRDPTITPQCKALYGLLITYGPSRIFPGHETLAGCLGVKRRTVITWLAQLRELGLIDWKRRGSTSNNYFILGYGNLLRLKLDDVIQGSQQMCNQDHNRCAPEITGSRSSYPDPVNNKEGPACAGTPTVESPPVVEEEPEPEPKPKAKARRKRDPRIDHPAIQEYRRATSLYPEKTWWEDIIEIVGTEEADVEFWYNVCHDYVGNNWNKKNVKNMLAYYSTRTLPEVSGAKNGGNGHGSHTPRPAQPVQEVQFHGRLPRI